MAGRWKTGWVVLPPTLKTPTQYAHRPHPDRTAATNCDRVIRDWPVTKEPPAGVKLCPRCQVKAGQGRRRDYANLQRDLAVRRAAKPNRTVRVDDVDAYDRAKSASSSVWAVRGGLPTLGRRA